ncbi:MAG: hypothetical protein KKA64_02745 [Nanoarchaeota archaeon]|nr:hypothetical protein [Nanoarchaeota archaeon]
MSIITLGGTISLIKEGKSMKCAYLILGYDILKKKDQHIFVEREEDLNEKINLLQENPNFHIIFLINLKRTIYSQITRAKENSVFPRRK